MLRRMMMASAAAGGGGYTYARIHITANNGDVNYVQLYEIEVAASLGGSTQCVGGTASASSNHGSYPPARAFDGLLADGNSWATNGSGTFPQWIQYQFPSGVTVAEVSITGTASAQAARCPKDFLIQVSNDGASWTTIKTVVGQTSWTNIQRRTFVI